MGSDWFKGEVDCDGNPLNRRNPLLLRAYEVVRHAPECPGGADEKCQCDAVPFLRDLEAFLSSPEAVGEAVAWLYHCHAGDAIGRSYVSQTRHEFRNDGTNWTEIPLYRHPVAADREVPKPILPPGVVTDQAYMDGWCDGQQCLIDSLSPKGAGE